MNKRWSQRELYTELNRKLDHIDWLLHKLFGKVIIMSGEVDSVIAVVTEMSGRVDSAVETMEQLAGLIVDNINDKPKLLQIASDLKAKSDKLASAIEANDPDSAPPAPPVEPAA